MIKITASIFLLVLGNTSVFAQVKAPVSRAREISDPGLAASIKRGNTVYTANCLSCHQADGGGVPDLNPPLIQTSYVLGNKYSLIKILLSRIHKLQNQLGALSTQNAYLQFVPRLRAGT